MALLVVKLIKVSVVEILQTKEFKNLNEILRNLNSQNCVECVGSLTGLLETTWHERMKEEKNYLDVLMAFESFKATDLINRIEILSIDNTFYQEII
ncbi:CLUMA_CG004448, isoform A [Clunio marinus]|uniref:CLUMA_CG004448, isoform A n=1 Tax=Clunio marinus TaxID=568069 RepID=A0A1J1HTQ2_9DIPT|nr:CLUMA_CG004448, isoform A [Clunio marinus]